MTLCSTLNQTMKLEQFLTREQEGAAVIIKKRCLEHSKPCEACSIRSKRQESNRENILENIQSEIGPDGRKRIRHSYVHRHDVSETFPPHKTQKKPELMPRRSFIKPDVRGSPDTL